MEPSGGALATRAAPDMPPAPPMFSAMICWPSFSESLCANNRATRSTGPPAGNGTTRVTGRVGQVDVVDALGCAATGDAMAQASVAPINVLIMAQSPCHLLLNNSAGFDRSCPSFDFGRDELVEIGRRPAFRCDNRYADVLEARAQVCIFDRFVGGLGKAANDGRGRALGNENEPQ